MSDEGDKSTTGDLQTPVYFGLEQRRLETIRGERGREREGEGGKGREKEGEGEGLNSYI